LALISDLINVLFPLLCGTKSDFLYFLGEATPALREKNCQIGKIFREDFSEKQFKRT
jgi:hypothetical protein